MSVKSTLKESVQKSSQPNDVMNMNIRWILYFLFFIADVKLHKNENEFITGIMMRLMACTENICKFGILL